MSISLNPASTVPVESHPLSPDDLPGPGGAGGRTGRRRATTKSHDEQHGVRPVTSYFALRQENEDSNGYSHHTYNSKRTSAAWDGSVRAKRKRPTQEPSTRSSTLSQVWERPSVPFFIVGTSERALSTPPGTPIQQPIFSLNGKNQTLHDLPARAASHVLTTPFHALDDSDIQTAVSDLSVLADEDNASVKHPYHSALRVLSEAVDKLGRARIELEQGRRRLLEKQTRIRELVKESGDPLRESLLAILDEARSDLESESDDDDGRLSLRDSLSVALSEDLTPTYPDPPSVISHTPPEHDPPDGDIYQPTNTSLAPSLVVSSESRSLLFTPSTDDLVPDQPVESPRTPSPVHTPLPLRTKSRANSSASLASMSSTASKGLGDWMGWFGKTRTPQPSKLDSAITEDNTSVNEEAVETQAAEERTPGPGASGRAEVKPTPTMRLANGLLNTLRIGSTTPQSSPPPAPASSHKRSHKRKISLNITAKSIPSSTVGSPVLTAFTLPPPLPAPPLAVTARATPEQQLSEELEPTTEPEGASVLSSGKEKDTPMQGATLRALSNATRVMTTDPASILVDHGQDVGELVTRLAWELVRGVRDEGITFREPVKPKAKDESKRNKAGAVKKLAIVGGGASSAVDKARRASTLGALASPLLGGFGAGTSKAKSPSMSAREEGAPGNSAVSVSAPTGAPLSTAPTAGALSVPLESIIPAIAKPPTQYLARTYTSLISPDFRPPSSFGGFTSDRFATREGAEPITDRFGFVYEVSSYDVLLLDRALRAGNSAPGCLTGIKVADREENDDWPADEDGDREFEVVRGSCTCVEGVRLGEEPAAGEPDVMSGNGNGASEAASMVSTTSSKRSSTRGKAARTLSLSAPLKVASLDYLPAPAEAALVPSHACPNTVRALVALITEVHDAMQARRKAQWDAFLRVRRDMKPVKASGRATGSSAASGGAAVMLGLGAHGAEDDVEELRQSEGLVGFAQMGLAANQGERKEFGRLVRVGIPLVYRAKVWLECSGALEMAEPGAFRDLLEDAVREGGIAIGEIEKDVGRTMPLNVFFGGDGVGVDKLRRVLRAYSRRNPGVGYCQGMNLVASTLLLVHADEEDAFWNLACIIEKHLPEDFFSPSLLVSRACPLVLLDYVHDLLPALFDHLTNLGVDLPAICFSWFLSLFTDCLPVETLFRVWDVFIVDGLDVLFRTALAILRINEAELLQAMSVPALYVALESLPTRMWEVDKLLKHEADLRPYVVNADIIKKRDARVKELKDLAT